MMIDSVRIGCQAGSSLLGISGLVKNKGKRFKLSCGTRRLYQIVFRRLIRFIRVEFWSWW